MASEEPSRRLADVPAADLRHSAVTASVILVALALFLWMMVSVLLAALLGVVTAIYLTPVSRWIEERIGSRGGASALALAGGLLPVVAVVAYSYMELRRAGEYLSEHAGEVSTRIADAIGGLPFVDERPEDAVQGAVETAAQWGTEVPAGVQSALAGFTVAASIFLFTAYYFISHREKIITYLRESVPSRYGPLTERLEGNVAAVLSGTVFAVFVTQAVKAGVVLVLNVTLGVPLAFTLAAAAFVIGLFPVVGSWTVYVPAAVYLLVFEGSTWRAVVMLVGGFTFATILTSMWLRPKLGAERSRVLDFYWMFVGLVAGVYAMGPEGIVLGPILIGVLKAGIDTVRANGRGGDVPDDDETPEAEVMSEEKLEAAQA